MIKKITLHVGNLQHLAKNPIVADDYCIWRFPVFALLDSSSTSYI